MKIKSDKCTPCSSLHLCVLRIAYLTHHYYVPLPSSISAFCTLFLSCVVLCQMVGKVTMFGVYAQIDHSSPYLPLLSFILRNKAALHVFFLSFILSHWLHHYLSSFFAKTFQHFLMCFSFKIN